MEFSEVVKEALGYYVYCLVDPRNQKIFYIGKGSGNRVFAHAYDAINSNDHSLKLETIREIHESHLDVQYYILRHNLTDKEAYIVESTLIDMLTYSAFNRESILTNIANEHHQWDEGIKTIEELNSTYDCRPIDVPHDGSILLVSLNKSYKAHAMGIYKRPNIYEATRKYWRIGRNRPQKIRYVLGVYHGIVRSVIKVDSYKWVEYADDGTKFNNLRCCFNGILLDDSPFLNKDVSAYPFGRGGAVTYIK